MPSSSENRAIAAQNLNAIYDFVRTGQDEITGFRKAHINLDFATLGLLTRDAIHELLPSDLLPETKSEPNKSLPSTEDPAYFPVHKSANGEQYAMGNGGVLGFRGRAMLDALKENGVIYPGSSQTRMRGGEPQRALDRALRQA